MKMPVSEIMDRLSIALLKHERAEVDMSAEIFAYREALTHYVDGEFYVDRLKIINGQIWDLEADIRRGKIDLSLEEVGRRALKIRDFNRGKNKNKKCYC